MVHHIKNRITYITNFRTMYAKYLAVVYRFQVKISPVEISLIQNISNQKYLRFKIFPVQNQKKRKIYNDYDE